MTIVITLAESQLWKETVAATTNKILNIEDGIEQLLEEDKGIVAQALSIDSVEQIIKKFDNIIMIYPSPEDYISEEWKRGSSIPQALESWRELAKSTLYIHGKARRRVTLINNRQLTNLSKKHRTQVKKLGLPIKGSPQVANDPFLAIGAKLAIEQDVLNRELYSELVASSVQLNNSIDLDIDSILIEESNKRTLLENTLTQLEESKVDANRLRLELSEVNNSKSQHITNLESEVCKLKALNESQAEKIRELEVKISEVQSDKDILAEKYSCCLEKSEELYNDSVSLSKKSDSLHLELVSLDGERSKLKDENELVKLHLATVQEELEYYFREVKDVREELEKERLNQDEKRRLYEGEIRDLKKLHDSNLLAVNQKNSTVENKNRELITKNSELLSRVTEYEGIIEKHKLQFHDERTNHIREMKQQQREFTKLETRYKQLRGDMANQSQKIKRLEYELHEIQTSNAWKIAAPARAVTRVIRKIDKKSAILQQDMGLLFTSDLFEPDWYLETYPDVKDAGMSPVEHYLKFGASEGRLPGPRFDGNWYLKRYPDVAESGMNPLIHYLKFGINEGRTGSPKLLESKNN